MIKRLEYPKYNIVLPDSKAKVKFRPFNVREEKIMLLALESGDDSEVFSAICDLVEVCAFNLVNFRKLSAVDAEYLFVQVRNKSLGEGLDVNAKCTSCGASNIIDINLDRVEIERSVAIDKKIKLTDNCTVVMKYPSVEVMFNAESGPDTANIATAKCIEYIEIDGELTDCVDETIDEIVAWLEDLNKPELAKMEEFLDSVPKLVYNDSFNCIKCKAHNTIKLEGLASFFA